MKVEVNKKEKQFEPIELVITIESERELHLISEMTSQFSTIGSAVFRGNLNKDVALSEILRKLNSVIIRL